MIDRWADRLSEYLDGDLDPRDEALVEGHLVECSTCRATLAELKAVVARGAALPANPPAADLWPGIRARIEEGAFIAPPGPVATRRRRVSFSVRQLAAAAVVLALLSGGSVWLALRGGSEPAQLTAAATDAAVPSIARFASSTTDYQTTIAELERVLAEGRAKLDPVTVAVLESNLKIIDAAITEAVAALSRDPGNAYLSQHLGNTMETKIEVLRRAAGIARAEI